MRRRLVTMPLFGSTRVAAMNISGYNFDRALAYRVYIIFILVPGFSTGKGCFKATYLLRIQATICGFQENFRSNRSTKHSILFKCYKQRCAFTLVNIEAEE